jgi:hypothetical protein
MRYLRLENRLGGIRSPASRMPTLSKPDGWSLPEMRTGRPAGRPMDSWSTPSLLRRHQDGAVTGRREPGNDELVIVQHQRRGASRKDVV